MTFDRLNQRIASEEFEAATDEYVQAQRRAFLDGLSAAAAEAGEFRHLREWLEEQRDEARQRYNETDETDELARCHAYISVLVKLSEIGCVPEDGGDRT